MPLQTEPGVTVAICCHNGAQRLPACLAHLAAQEVSPSIRWEVLVIDNGSTDETPLVAQASWPNGHSAPLRVVHEPNLGLAHARRQAFMEARYDLVSFIDDDNWVVPNWVETVDEIMRQHPEAGACGGPAEAVFDVTPPTWFARHQGKYGCGPQANGASSEGWTTGFLRGAGLTVRRVAWDRLVACGFRFRLVGRQGSALSCSEDVELCHALRLAGWRLRYDPRLRLQHFMPSSRLTWPYLRRTWRAIGAASSMLDAYVFWGPGRALRRSWHLKSAGMLFRLIRMGMRHPQLLVGSASEGEDAVLRWELTLGRLEALVRGRRVRDQAFADVERLRTSLSEPRAAAS